MRRHRSYGEELAAAYLSYEGSDASFCIDFGIDNNELGAICTLYRLTSCEACGRNVSESETRDGECVECSH